MPSPSSELSIIVKTDAPPGVRLIASNVVASAKYPKPSGPTAASSHRSSSLSIMRDDAAEKFLRVRMRASSKKGGELFDMIARAARGPAWHDGAG